MDHVFDLDHNEMNGKNSSSSSRLRFHGFRAVKKLLRILEICFAFFFVAWASTRLPFAVRISGDYFRRLISLVLSHLFVFLLSNLIVATLYFKSRKPNISSEDVGGHLGFCQEFIRNIEGRRNQLIAGESSLPAAGREDILVYQDKQTILEGPRVVRRCQSENMRMRRSSPGKKRNLRRAESEVVDELSNDEFRRAIEAFIAKQIKFHREERLAIVLHG